MIDGPLVARIEPALAVEFIVWVESPYLDDSFGCIAGE